MKALLDEGLLHGDAMTVTGKTMAENMEALNPRRHRWRGVAHFGQPLPPTGGITILKGRSRLRVRW
jgi:dihydroxy-acid dehydratase